MCLGLIDLSYDLVCGIILTFIIITITSVSFSYWPILINIWYPCCTSTTMVMPTYLVCVSPARDSNPCSKSTSGGWLSSTTQYRSFPSQNHDCNQTEINKSSSAVLFLLYSLFPCFFMASRLCVIYGLFTQYLYWKPSTTLIMGCGANPFSGNLTVEYWYSNGHCSIYRSTCCRSTNDTWCFRRKWLEMATRVTAYWHSWPRQINI